jgi:hypothetical protein
MFHVPPAIVKFGLVQLPVCSVVGTRTVAGPTAAEGVEVVDGVDVAEDAPAVVVGEALDPAAADPVLWLAPVAELGDVEEPEPAAGGSL